MPKEKINPTDTPKKAVNIPKEPPVKKEADKADKISEAVTAFREKYQNTLSCYENLKNNKSVDFKKQQLQLANYEGQIAVFKLVLGEK